MSYESNIPTSKNILWALVGGVFVGLLLGWLLAYLAVLPAMLGLIFFALAGMVIGYLMFRIGQPAAPVPVIQLWGMAIAAGAIVWCTELAVECDMLPDQVKLSIESMLPEALNEEDGA